MKKIFLLTSTLCVLTSFSASAQNTQEGFGAALASVFTTNQYPHNSDWDRRNGNYQYWQQSQIDQARRDQERRDHDRMRQESYDHDRDNNGNHYAYGKDPEHHKDGWKDGKKHHGKKGEYRRENDNNDRNNQHHNKR